MKDFIFTVIGVVIGIMLYNQIAHADTMCYFVDNILICTNY